MGSGSELRGVAPLRIGLLSPCGWGNLGDAAIQQTIIHELKSRYENVLITGITLVPADTIRRHGIDAVPIGAISLPQYGIDSAGYRNDEGGPTKRLEDEHGSCW